MWYARSEGLEYCVTPKGLAPKPRLTSGYPGTSLRVHGELRRAASEALSQVREAGHRAIRVDGDGVALEILRLTCLQEDVQIVRGSAERAPEAGPEGIGFVVKWPNRPTAGETDGQLDD